MSNRNSVSLLASVVTILTGLAMILMEAKVSAQTGTLQQVLQQVDTQLLANEARLRGDSRRGAIVYHTSPAGCTKCHQSGEGISPLGPDLSLLGDKISDVHLVESLLFPSKSIREGFQIVQLLTEDGQSQSGMLVREDAENIVLRDASNLQDAFAR